MGLYDQDNEAVTTGARFNAEQLDEVLKTRQSEGDRALAAGCYRTALQKLNYLNGRLDASERVADWPASVPVWIRETKAELDAR